MFSKDFEKASVDSSYLPIYSPRDLFVRLIHATNQENEEYTISLRELLDKPPCEEDTSTAILEIDRHGLFLLWITRSHSTSTNSLDDALILMERCLEGERTHMCISFQPEGTRNATLAIFTRYDRELLCLLGMPMALQENIARRHQHQKLAGAESVLARFRAFFNIETRTNKKAAWISLSVILAIAVLVMSITHFVASYTPDEYHSWVAYDTRGSVGPKYQLSINGKNASKFASYIAQSGEWALRIDDQAIIPLHLMDEEEKHYQQWFQDRYPETNQIRLNSNYINETWLSSPLADLVPADDMFHFSHCVLAVKRYIKAKETGHHVCGRDIDHEHIQHCIHALDWWAFPDPSGKRGETIPNPKRDLSWRTKVCFD